jgi:hypothetical protein
VGEGKYGVRTHVFGPGAGQYDVLPADTARVALVWGIHSGAGGPHVVPVGWGGEMPRLLLPFSGWQQMTCNDLGPLVSGAWAVNDTAGTNEIACVEVYMLPGAQAPAGVASHALSGVHATDAQERVGTDDSYGRHYDDVTHPLLGHAGSAGDRDARGRYDVSRAQSRGG